MDDEQERKALVSCEECFMAKQENLIDENDIRPAKFTCKVCNMAICDYCITNHEYDCERYVNL